MKTRELNFAVIKAMKMCLLSGICDRELNDALSRLGAIKEKTYIKNLNEHENRNKTRQEYPSL